MMGFCYSEPLVPTYEIRYEVVLRITITKFFQCFIMLRGYRDVVLKDLCLVQIRVTDFLLV